MQHEGRQSETRWAVAVVSNPPAAGTRWPSTAAAGKIGGGGKMVPWTYPFKMHPGATGDGTGGCEEGTDGRSTAKGDLFPLQQTE